MKLVYRITSRISVALLVVMAVWATLFYFIIVEEINDETDDSLEDYSEYIITRALAGEPLPSKDNGTNNSYHIEEVTPEYAAQNPSIRYHGEMVYIQSQGETEPARILKTIFSDSANKYHELTVSIPTIEKSDLQEAILHWIIFLYLGLLVVIIGLNWIILQRNFNPLYKLLNCLNAFSIEKKFSEPDIHTKTMEFQKLNDTVVRSARRNIETYEQQKSFIGHASHELQTPLAICLNRLEMLAEDPGLTEKQLEEILKTKQSLDFAVKLNKTLLLLTKIENNQFPDKKEIQVNELVKKLANDYSEVYANRNIPITINEERPVKIEMNETLASVLFGNLLKNAFVHNHDNGSIDISITNTSISIVNTGSGESLNSDLIFNRFYQASKKDGSTGLGLALTKSVCSLYGMDIRYRFSDGKHIFSLSFH
ncbi:MAG: HAMP domain-containing histidine kinase [Dysgonamonadaceae bacterium]|jgi:signal transduction histidine kinase|nr:HAMP domain-containing histidine kinase [Dysgonamonadaceae bacterium]